MVGLTFVTYDSPPRRQLGRGKNLGRLFFEPLALVL